MRDAASERQREERPPDVAQDIDVGRVRCQNQRGRGERCRSLRPRLRNRSTDERMREVIQKVSRVGGRPDLLPRQHQPLADELGLIGPGLRRVFGDVPSVVIGDVNVTLLVHGHLVRA